MRKLSEPCVGVGLGEGGDCDGDEVGAGDDDGPDGCYLLEYDEKLVRLSVYDGDVNDEVGRNL